MCNRPGPKRSSALNLFIISFLVGFPSSVAFCDELKFCPTFSILGHSVKTLYYDLQIFYVANSSKINEEPFILTLQILFQAPF